VSVYSFGINLNILEQEGLFLSQNSLNFLVPRPIHHGKSLLGGNYGVSYEHLFQSNPPFKAILPPLDLEKRAAIKKIKEVGN
jgi:hypothetical protein